MIKATNTHTHTICNRHCFSTATMVARTRLKVTLHVHCLSCLLYCTIFVSYSTFHCAVQENSM